MNKENKKQDINQEQDDILGFVFEDLKELSTEEFSKLKDIKILPTADNKTIDEFEKNLNDEEIKGDVDHAVAAMTTATEKEYVNPDDIGEKPLNKVDNKISHNDKNLMMEEPSMDKKAKNPKAALLKLSKATGLGSVVHIPLWHSGFWVTIKPLEDIIELELAIADRLTEIGKQTSTLVFSNHNVLFAKVVLEYFKKNIIATSLNVPKDKEIEEFININDMYIIAAGLAKSMYPKGFQVVVPCKNTAVTDESGKPKCTYKMSVKADISKLLFVDRSKLTDLHLSTMANRTPKSVSIETVEEYQKTLLKNDEEITFDLEGTNATIVLQNPSVADYISIGEYFIEILTNKTEEVITKISEKADENEIKNTIANEILLNTYLHYIKSIYVDMVELTTLDDKKEALEIISHNDELLDKVLNGVKNFINDNQVAVIGVPNFTCPECKTEASEDTIIPLAVYNYFFILTHSRFEKLRQRMTKKQNS